MIHSRRAGGAAGALVLAGVGLVVATIAWRWGHVPYGIGVAVVAVGAVWCVVTLVRGTAWRIALGAAVALAVVAGAVLAVTGVPRSTPRWDVAEGDGPGDSSARTGELIVVGGTARDVQTGEVAWAHGGPDAETLLVDDALVVIGTSDGSIGVDPASGREVWRSAVSGRGIAYDDDVLVVASSVADDRTEAVAVDLATGETRWQQAGRPVMECDLGPADRFSPAREQSHVLLSRVEARSGTAELLDLADGHTTIADVDCSLSARMVGGVLLEAGGRELAGRSPADGAPLWSTPVDEPWHIEGGGSTVVTATTGGALAAIDVATGRSTAIDPPPGTDEVGLPSDEQRATQVWTVVDQGAELSMWNPGTGQLVRIPDAVTVGVEEIDVSSGWVALSGTTRDLTGAESDQCWALSQEGRLSDPVPGPRCRVADGLLLSGDDVFPVR
jgi:outer membrane protein assembly factor BamB